MNTTETADLVEVRSHTVRDEWSHGRRIATREELYPKVPATWRGSDVRVSLEASRYTSSDDVWSPWRIIVRDVEYVDGGKATETAAKRLRDDAVAHVQRWLDSDKYVQSRQEAFGWMLVTRLRDDAGNLSSTPITAELIGRYRDEVHPDLAERIDNGLDAFYSLRDAVGR